MCLITVMYENVLNELVLRLSAKIASIFYIELNTVVYVLLIFEKGIIE